MALDDFDDEDDLSSEVIRPLIPGGDPTDTQDIEFKDGKFPQARQVFAVIGFFGFAIVYAMRVNLSISVVSMVNHTAIVPETNQTFTNVCPLPSPVSNSTVPAVSIFHKTIASSVGVNCWP